MYTGKTYDYVVSVDFVLWLKQCVLTQVNTFLFSMGKYVIIALFNFKWATIPAAICYNVFSGFTENQIN